MSQYRKFARVYDRMGADRHSRNMVDYTLEILRGFGADVTEGLDLCCGTGTALKLFAGQGLTMSGLDRSRDMLNVAREKLKEYDVRLYRQNLPRFELRRPGCARKIRQFDLVTSFFDSLNYLLTARDLMACFKSVFRHLRPGGWFVFDMNTPHALRSLWRERLNAGIRSDLGWIWKLDYDPKTEIGACHAAFFVKRGSAWERFDELHRETAYRNADIRRMLRDAGFTIKGYYRCFTFDRPTRETNRVCVVARKSPAAK